MVDVLEGCVTREAEALLLFFKLARVAKPRFFGGRGFMKFLTPFFAEVLALFGSSSFDACGRKDENVMTLEII